MKNARVYHLRRAKEIVDTAKHHARGLTALERAEVKRALDRAEEIRKNEEYAGGMPPRDPDLGYQFGNLSGDGGLAAKMRAAAAETDGKLLPPVTVPAKAIIDNPADAAPTRLGGARELAADERFAYSILPRADLGNATTIQELISDSRVLASPGDMRRPLTSASEKPVTTVGAALSDFTPEMIATLSELVPNAIVALPAFSKLIDGALALAFREALDDYAISELTAFAGTVDNTGADLFEQLRKARTNLEGLGYDPKVALVSPADAESLDLSRSAGSAPGDGPFMLSPAPRDVASSPLWGLKVVTAKGITNPIVLDPSGTTLYVGTVTAAADPFEGFSTNETRFRLEGPACVVVHDGDSIHVVAAA